jgi:hypothetical protein
MGDEDGEKRQKYFEDRKRERERQLKERIKRLDGSDSEVDEGDVKEGKQTQMGAYDRFFEDKKREREKQLKERKKCLDGSDSDPRDHGLEAGPGSGQGMGNSLLLGRLLR